MFISNEDKKYFSIFIFDYLAFFLKSINPSLAFSSPAGFIHTVKMVLHEYTYIFAIGTFFALLEAYNNGANDVANAWATSVSSRSVTYRQAMVCPHESKSILERILILKLLYSCGTHADHAIDTLSDIRDDRCSGCRCQNCFHNQGVLRTER